MSIYGDLLGFNTEISAFRTMLKEKSDEGLSEDLQLILYAKKQHMKYNGWKIGNIFQDKLESNDSFVESIAKLYYDQKNEDDQNLIPMSFNKFIDISLPNQIRLYNEMGENEYKNKYRFNIKMMSVVDLIKSRFHIFTVSQGTNSLEFAVLACLLGNESLCKNKSHLFNIKNKTKAQKILIEIMTTLLCSLDRYNIISHLISTKIPCVNFTDICCIRRSAQFGKAKILKLCYEQILKHNPNVLNNKNSENKLNFQKGCLPSDILRDSLQMAIKYGHLDCVKYLRETMNIELREKDLSNIPYKGVHAQKCIDYLLNNGYKYGYNSDMIVYWTNDLNKLKQAMEKDCLWNSETMTDIAEKNNFPMLKWAFEQGYKWHYTTPIAIAQNDNIEMMEYCHKHMTIDNMYTDCFYSKESPTVVKYAKQKSGILMDVVDPFDELEDFEYHNVIYTCAKYKSLKCFKFACKHGADYYSNPEAIFDFIIRGEYNWGNQAVDAYLEYNESCLNGYDEENDYKTLEMLKYYHELMVMYHTTDSASDKGPFKFPKSVCRLAVYMGYIECLKYLHANGAEFNKDTLANVRNNHNLDCAKFVLENGGELPNSDVLNDIIIPKENEDPYGFTDNLQLFKYLCSKGLLPSSETVDYAIEYGCPKILQYLYDISPFCGSFFPKDITKLINHLFESELPTPIHLDVLDILTEISKNN